MQVAMYHYDNETGAFQTDEILGGQNKNDIMALMQVAMNYAERYCGSG